MSNTFSLAATARHKNALGTAASRSLRKNNRVPGVIYGKAKEPIHFHASHRDVLQQLKNEAFQSSIANLMIDGTEHKVLLKEYQTHPFKLEVTHLDFLSVSDSTEVSVVVPIHFLNEAKSKGVTQEGGRIVHMMTEVSLKAQASNIPSHIEVDMLEVGLNQVIHLSDLELPEGVKIPQLIDAQHDLAVCKVELAVEQQADDSTDVVPQD